MDDKTGERCIREKGMRKVLFEGHWFQVCDSETELKKEILKRYGVVHPHQGLHHIFGRIGILKLMPDNVIPINLFYHVMQKSINNVMREHFEDMIKQKVNSRLYSRLQKLADHIKNRNVLFGK